MPKTNYSSVKPQNDPTPHEHAVQGLHATLGVVLPILTHLSIPIVRNYLPIKIILPCGQPNLAPWVSIPPKPHMHVDMP
jgi:hypothetical protein